MGKNLIRLVLSCGVVLIIVGSIQMLLLTTAKFGTSVPVGAAVDVVATGTFPALSSGMPDAATDQDSIPVLGEGISLDAILTDAERASAATHQRPPPQDIPGGDFSDVSQAEAEALECKRVVSQLENTIAERRGKIGKLDAAHRDACKRPQYKPFFSTEKGLTAGQVADIKRQRIAEEEARLKRKRELAETLRSERRILRELTRDYGVLKQNLDGAAVREVLSRY